MPTGATSKLKIVRRGGYTDKLRAYKIFVNDEQVGTIDRNSVLNLEVPSGPLKVQARLDWTESRPLMTEAAPDRMIEIEVSNRWGLLLAMWGSTFGFRSYLKLEQLQSSRCLDAGNSARRAGPI
jgi:hypothetical protein